MVRSSDQKDVVRFFQIADQTARLLDQLNVMLGLETGISGK